MGRDATIRLSDYLQRRAGSHVRGVLHYDGESYSAEYAREDIVLRYDEADLETRVEHLRAANEGGRKLEALYDHGRLKATIQLFEDVVELHFPHGDETGTAVTLDSMELNELYDFVGSCQTVLNGGSTEPVQLADQGPGR